MKRLVLILAIISIVSALPAQITVDNTITPEEAMQTLLGENITISNLTYTGLNHQIGNFSCGDCNLDFDNGIILGTGDVEIAIGPNNNDDFNTLGGGTFGTPDADLESLVTSNLDLNDLAVIEFDFVVLGDSIWFDYVWASEEYPQFSEPGEIFNDVFGFFISGPGLDGPFSNNSSNIALIPNTQDPVSIQNINNGIDGIGGGSGCDNCEFYVHNGDGDQDEPQYTDDTVVEYNGYTSGLIASQGGLICGETYHLKIAISDVGDASYDSAVFLRAGSLTSNLVVDVELDIATIGGEAVLVEDCQPGSLNFTRPAGISDQIEFIIQIEFFGDAENGVDYTELPSEIIFGPGVNSLSFEIEAYGDNLEEASEEVELRILNLGTCSGQDVENSFKFDIEDTLPFESDLITSELICAPDSTVFANLSGGIEPYNYTWTISNTNELISTDESATIAVEQGQAVPVTVAVTDFCEHTFSHTFELYKLEALEITTPSILYGNCLTVFEIDPDFNYPEDELDLVWTGDIDFNQAGESFVNYNGYDSGTIEISGDAGCGNTAVSATEIVIGNPPINITTIEDGVICFGGVASLSATAEGGAGELLFHWVLESAFENAITVSPSFSTTYELEVTDQCSNSATDEVFIEVQHVNVTYTTEAIDELTHQFMPTLTPECEDCTFEWNFSDGDTSTESSPIHEFESTGFIGAGVTVTTSAGCQAIYNGLVNVPPLVYVPNSFTPYYDGINDVFKVVSNGIDEYELTIFDRWGGVLFNSTDPEEAWNGSKNGGDHFVPNGIYSYVLQYRSLDTEAETRSGTITIMR